MSIIALVGGQENCTCGCDRGRDGWMMDGRLVGGCCLLTQSGVCKRT
jgi:hypothetical protein